MVENSEITSLLSEWFSGDNTALERALPLIYSELHRLAASKMRDERSGHSLQPTALINEAVIRILGGTPIHVKNRSEFIGILGHAMREVLVDHARRKQAGKRFQQSNRVDFEGVDAAVNEQELIEIDDALKQLALVKPRQARVVELKFFGGLDLDEIAQITNSSSATVTRDWRLARAWLQRHIQG